MATDLTNYNQTYSFSFPDELRNATSDFPFMLFEIIKYPVTFDMKIKDNEKSTAKKGLLDYAIEGLNSVNTALVNSPNTTGTYQPYDGKSNVKPQVVATIQLPITNNIVDNLGIDWHMDSRLATQALINGYKGLVKDYKNSDFKSVDGSLNAAESMLKTVGNTAEQLLMSTSLAADLMKKTINRIPNPKMQALFDGVQSRQFTFEYIFTPTTEEECNTIYNILKTFRMYSLPNLTDDALIMDFPHEYNISFQNVKGFPLMGPCVCTAITTNWTPNTLQLLSSGHSVQIVLALNFVETILLTQQYSGI